MKRFIGYGSIPQMRQVVKDVTHDTQYIDYDEKLGHPITDETVALPTLTFIGWEKIHGTNAAVCYSNPDGMWVQSRKHIIDSSANPDYNGARDNAACALAAWTNKEAWLHIIKKLAYSHSINLDTHVVAVYYEWAGGNIQKKSALTGLPKQAIIFAHFKVLPLNTHTNGGEEETDYEWLTTNGIDCIEAGIFNISNFPKVEISIDFNNPQIAQNTILTMVDELESNSKVGVAFGVQNNIGEGYVFTSMYKDKLYRFKAKGEKHSSSTGKVKTLGPVDEEFEQKKLDFVNNVACVSWRLEQMFTEVESEFTEVTIKQIGDFLRKVFQDVLKEESDLMLEQGFNSKAVNPLIAKVAKSYYLSRI